MHERDIVELNQLAYRHAAAVDACDVALFLGVFTLDAPEFPMRWRWGVNDLALWDNMAFQHYAARDYHGNRVLQKAYVQGERPVGPR